MLAAPPWALWQEKYPARAAEVRRLWLLDRQIASRRWSGTGAEGLTFHREMIGGWLEQRDELEERLAIDIPELAQRRRLRGVNAQAVSAAVPAGWVLVELAHFRQCDFRTLFTRTDADPLPGRYVAFVLQAGAETPQMVDLGPAAAIDALAAAWRRQLVTGEGDAGPALRAALIDPLLPLLAGCAGLIVAPDGELLHAPLDALPLDGGCLMDRFAYRQIISGRDLLRGRRQVTPGQSVVVGDPAFAGGPAAAARALPPKKESGLLARLGARAQRRLGALPPSGRRRPRRWKSPRRA